MNLKDNIVELKIDGKTLYFNKDEFKCHQEFNTFLSQRMGYIPKDSRFYEIENKVKDIQEGVSKAIQQTIKDLDNDLVKSGKHIGEIWKQERKEIKDENC